MDAAERSKVRGARDMLRECAKQLRSIDATGHAALADMHADQIDGLLLAPLLNEAKDYARRQRAKSKAGNRPRSNNARWAQRLAKG